MEPERRDEWAARVVAWHHRDPLALRVTPQQVEALGWLDLPFAGAGARRSWRAVFTETVLPGVSSRRVAAWARRHGQESRPETGELPLHQVAIERRLVRADDRAVVLWVGRATLQTAAGPVEVLLDSRPGGAVLGRRRRAGRRVAIAAAALALVLGLAGTFAWVVWRGADPAAAPVPGPVAAASAASSASAASGVVASAEPAASGAASSAAAASPASAAVSAAASAAVLPSAPASAASAASAVPAGMASAASAAAPPPAASRPASAPDRRRVQPPPGVPPVAAPTAPVIRPVRTDANGRRVHEPPPFLLDDTQRLAARQAGEAARAASAARRVDRYKIAYALATRAVRTQAESRLLGRDLDAALAALPGAPRCPRVDVMPVGDNWRSVCWPMLQRAEAERLRDQLAERGQRVELIEF